MTAPLIRTIGKDVVGFWPDHVAVVGINGDHEPRALERFKRWLRSLECYFVGHRWEKRDWYHRATVTLPCKHWAGLDPENAKDWLALMERPAYFKRMTWWCEHCEATEWTNELGYA